MTEEILTFVISLLAVYGLCGLCMRIVTWLTCTKTEKSFAVIPITDLSQLTDRIMWAKLKFEPSFGKRSVEILVADCGLCKSESAVLERYCRGEGLCFCKVGNCGKAIYDNICKESPDDV